MNIIEVLKKFRRSLISKYNEYQKYNSKYKIEGIIKGKKQMLYVLSGYKPFLWEDVFSRIKAQETKDMEVCIVSSGKYVKELSDICKKNDWVYISTKLNNVCVASNIVMMLYDKAEYIFKLDEDIYLPDNYFLNMKNAYDLIEKNEPVQISYICPVLPLGFYGMHDFLVKFGALNEYEKRFGKHLIGGTVVNPIFREKKGVDTFIWEKIGNFDSCAKIYSNEKLSYAPCFSRSGIAAILFKRDFWNRFGGFKHYRGKGVGNDGDEGQLTSYCALNYQISYCINNILVGHFSFGGSEDEVLQLRKNRPEIFKKEN